MSQFIVWKHKLSCIHGEMSIMFDFLPPCWCWARSKDSIGSRNTPPLTHVLLYTMLCYKLHRHHTLPSNAFVHGHNNYYVCGAVLLHQWPTGQQWHTIQEPMVLAIHTGNHTRHSPVYLFLHKWHTYTFIKDLNGISQRNLKLHVLLTGPQIFKCSPR
jgi:hypothetical protein